MSDIVSTIKLSKPIQTHKGPLSTLDIKEPTARLFINFGSPFEIEEKKNGDFKIHYDDKVLAKFAADMTGHDELVLSSLVARDYLTLRDAIARAVLTPMGVDPGPLGEQSKD